MSPKGGQPARQVEGQGWMGGAGTWLLAVAREVVCGVTEDYARQLLGLGNGEQIKQNKTLPDIPRGPRRVAHTL